MNPVKALSRTGILGKGLLNRLDGGVEILDDLDDHWTARHHKDERAFLLAELQDLAAEKSVRITFLGYVFSILAAQQNLISAVVMSTLLRSGSSTPTRS